MKKLPTKYIQTMLVASILVALFGYNHVFANRASSVLDTTAKQIVADCSKIKGDRSACYETEVPSLYPTLSVSEVFTVIRSIRQMDHSYQFCHVLAHKLGTRVVAEDPSKWVESISLNPSDGLCSNGFIHGIIVGRFSSEVLDDATIAQFMPDFQRACEPRPDWQPSNLDQAICYHGMGHLFDFITNANLTKGLSLCGKIGESPTGDFRQVCTEGIFMQIYQPLEPDDYQLIAQMKVVPTKDTVRTFCASFGEPAYVGACLRESWPFFQKDILSGVGGSTFCAGQPNELETKNCYNSISSIVGRMSLASPTQAEAACNNFPAEWQPTCYSFSAEALLEEDRNDATKAVTLCAEGQGNNARACIEDLVSHAQFIFGSNKEQYTNFCKAVPDYLKQQCLQNFPK